MERKTCFFIGHRDAPEGIRERLLAAVERHIADYGVTEFVVGRYGRFDAMAAAAVRTAKKGHPDVGLVLLLPYYPVIDAAQIEQDYDATFFPPGMETVPKQLAIVRANEYMIRNSQFFICYNIGSVGNTRRLVKYAAVREQKGLIRIENLAEGLHCKEHLKVLGKNDSNPEKHVV